jgi:hypothetical protein
MAMAAWRFGESPVYIVHKGDCLNRFEKWFCPEGYTLATEELDVHLYQLANNYGVKAERPERLESEEEIVESACQVCRTAGVDPDFPICSACERRYPRLLILAAMAPGREVYLARLVTGETVKFRHAALDGDYVMLWGLNNSGSCAPVVHGGPPVEIRNFNVRADAIVYVAELPPMPAKETPIREKRD